LRQQIVFGEVFCQSEAYSFGKDADIEAVLMSVRPLDEQSGSTVGIYRRFGRPRFTQRESKIEPIILTEIPWLHEQGWSEAFIRRLVRFSSQRRP